jgi:hypothetical protein
MHLTDEQLNEYLDHETNARAQIESHLASCADCVARLQALQQLFSEIESLPDVAISRVGAWRLDSNLRPAPQIPRSLQLTVTLQAALVVVVFLMAAPFVMPFLSPYVSSIPEPSPAGIFRQLQSQWDAWLDLLSTFQFPTMPELPVIDVSSLFMMVTVSCICLLWLVGNVLLLRNQIHKASR